MIICGFAGIGKSTLCSKEPNFIDLESTPFDKDWNRYTKVAQYMSNQGYNVMLSCHEDLRKTLYEKGVEYVLVLPHKYLKDEYIERYKQRGNAEIFIKSLDENWDKYTNYYDWEKVQFLSSGQYLSDIYTTVVL